MGLNKTSHCHLEAEAWTDPRSPVEMGWRLLGDEWPRGPTHAAECSSQNNNC